MVDRLMDLGVTKVYCGSQFSAALTSSGKVYTWGKGDNFRLGHGSEDHVRFPKLVENLGSDIVDLSVGCMHVVAVSKEGKLYGWGKNDMSQLGYLNNSVPTPTILSNLNTNYVSIVCGANNTIAWTNLDSWSVPLRAPFVIDISEETFRWLDSLLAEIWDGLDGKSGIPPRQEEECLACASLSILKLQMLAVRHHNTNLAGLGLKQGSALLSSLKKKVVELASNSGVLETIQFEAQQVLEASWMILLPTADERARALSTLLPSQNTETAGQSVGRKFMTDLLVSSLMADGGLRTALRGAIRMEVKELEEVSEKEGSDGTKDKPFGDELMTEQAQLESETKRAAEASTWEDRSSTIPLLYLVKQLMKNSSAQALSKLQALNMDLISSSISEDILDSQKTESSPSLKLLIKFQRLLVAELYSSGPDNSGDGEQELDGVLALLRKYLHYLCCHVLELLPTATATSSLSQRHFLAVSSILDHDLVGVLLPELVISLILLQIEKSSIFNKIEIIPGLTCLMESLGKMNLILSFDSKS